MEIAVLLSAGLREWIDFGVIIGILMLNAIVGWYQEKQAADVVASLKGDIAMKGMFSTPPCHHFSTNTRRSHRHSWWSGAQHSRP